MKWAFTIQTLSNIYLTIVHEYSIKGKWYWNFSRLSIIFWDLVYSFSQKNLIWNIPLIRIPIQTTTVSNISLPLMNSFNPWDLHDSKDLLDSGLRNFDDRVNVNRKNEEKFKLWHAGHYYNVRKHLVHPVSYGYEICVSGVRI